MDSGCCRAGVLFSSATASNATKDPRCAELPRGKLGRRSQETSEADVHVMSPTRSVAAALLILGARPLLPQAVGSRAPDFTLKTLAGDTAILSRYKGHP